MPIVVITDTMVARKDISAWRLQPVRRSTCFSEVTLNAELAVLTCWVDASFCRKADYAPDLKYISKRAPQSSTPGSTFTPVIGVPNQVVERKPIAVLQKSFPDVFNMFVLALQSLQARNEATDISYYQVAGKRSNKLSKSTIAHQDI